MKKKKAGVETMDVICLCDADDLVCNLNMTEDHVMEVLEEHSCFKNDDQDAWIMTYHVFVQYILDYVDPFAEDDDPDVEIRRERVEEILEKIDDYDYVRIG